MKEAMEDWHTIGGQSDEIFLHLYEAICDDRRDILHVGTIEHYNMVFDGLRTADFVQAKGDRVQLTRWGSWHHAMKAFDKSWHSRLALLCVTALKLGWVTSVDDLPLFGSGGFEDFRPTALSKKIVKKHDLAAASASSAASSSAGSSSSSAVAPAASASVPAEAVPPAADAEPEDPSKAQQSCLTVSQLVMKVLGDKRYQILARIVIEVADPVWVRHNDLYRSLKGPESVLAAYLGWAKGSYLGELADIWKVLDNVHSLAHIGLQVTYDSCMFKEPLVGTHPLIVQDSLVCEKLFEFALHLVRFRLLSMLHYSHSFPGALAMLSSATEEDRAAGLAYLHTAWKAISWAESRRHDDKLVHTLWKAVPFCSWSVIRELCIDIGQCNFAAIPKASQEVLHSIFSGCQQTCASQYRSSFWRSLGSHGTL
jgi:hypothetical protein